MKMNRGIEITNVTAGANGTTADVTIGTETRTLPATIREYENSVTVSGIAARMGRTGTKIWRAELTKWNNGNISVIRDGNFRNPHGNGLVVTGFYDAAAKNVCQHSSQYVNPTSTIGDTKVEATRNA